MKKLILKTALITLGTVIILLIAVFGLMSLCAPAVMMRLTASIGLDSISGDYAYQEYERSGKIEYLSRSFIVAANAKKDRAAEKRFEILYEENKEEFAIFCAEQEPIVLTKDKEGNAVKTVDYRSYVCGLAAQMKYRTAETDEEKEAVCDFAISETDLSFPTGNPVVTLATTAASEQDKEFCEILLGKVYGSNLNSSELEKDKQNDFVYIMAVLINVMEGDNA